MAGIGNFDVTAVLKANVSDFQRGMAQAQASMKQFQSATGSTMQTVGSTNNRYNSITRFNFSNLSR